MWLECNWIAETCAPAASQVTPYHVHSVPAAPFQFVFCVHALPPVALYSAINPARSCTEMAADAFPSETNDSTARPHSTVKRISISFVGVRRGTPRGTILRHRPVQAGAPRGWGAAVRADGRESRHAGIAPTGRRADMSILTVPAIRSCA